ncbi:MAG TPA: protein kinase [Kofleriaceae bacterium]|nr:protein kinase [Kofleriaceae bacterium]
MSDPMTDEVEPPPTTRADERAAQRLVDARPDVDHYVREVMRARVAAELFGSAPAVTVGRYELRRQVGRGGGGSVFVAWDPELTREVALKLIVAADPALRARALAEGQALARLSHPNVVPVFDVGVVDERVYLVMELIRGASLRSFAASARPREVIAAYRQCAHGLAAAHAAKLVHRDFKPDNAVMGSDGRVRVVDFGLAIDDRRDDSAHGSGRAGTPQYMPPEQRRGEPLTAAADQYAFAASLKEALPAVPAWLARILDRALADDPAQRFPSMDALGAALARDPRTIWRRRGLVALPVAVAIAGYAVGLARESGPAPCSGGAGEIASAWPARRIAVVTRVASLGTPYAGLAAERLGTGVDAYVARWLATHRTGCLAHRRGELSDAMYDRRQICLASARTQLGALLELGGNASADRIDSLVRAIPELPDLAHCADAEAPAVPPPTQAQTAGAADLRERLDRARVRLEAGADDLEAELTALTTDARALGYPPLLAGALLAQGTFFLRQTEYRRAEEPLRQAHVEALRSRDYRGAVEAFARLAWVLSKRLDQPADRALDGLAQIGPLAEGLPGDAQFAKSLLHNNLGGIALNAGDSPRARDEFGTAIALARNVTGPGAIELTAALQGLALVTDDAARRDDLFGRRISMLQHGLGDAHPLTLSAQITAALTSDAPADALARLAGPCHQLAALHPARGAAIAECAFELGWLHLDAGKPDDARRDFELARRAEAAGRFARPAAAYLAVLANQHAAAERAFRELLAEAPVDAATPWHRRFHVAQLELGLGLAADGAGKRDDARAAFLRARVHLEAASHVRHWQPMSWRIAWLDRRLQ